MFDGDFYFDVFSIVPSEKTTWQMAIGML
jgi:hypothetical protein